MFRFSFQVTNDALLKCDHSVLFSAGVVVLRNSGVKSKVNIDPVASPTSRQLRALSVAPYGLRRSGEKSKATVQSKTSSLKRKRYQ